jgi:hypothetical protein
MKTILFLVIFVNLYTDEFYFFPDGAPVSRCSDMLPGHRVAPIDRPSPYRISLVPVHRNQIGLNKQYYVSLFSTQDIRFKGFLLEARGRWDGESLGKWITEVPHTKTIDCFNKPAVIALDL